MTRTFRTVLGDERSAEVAYGDGSVNCPYCKYPVRPDEETCRNPCCDAHPGWSADALWAHRNAREQEAERHRRDEESRRQSDSAALERIRAHHAWELEQIAEARRRGACIRCLFLPGWERVRFVRHRKSCPKA